MQETTDKRPTIDPSAHPLPREQFINQAEDQLNAWRVRVDQLAKAAERLAGDAKVLANKEMIQLKAKLQAAAAQLETSKTVQLDKWEEAKRALEASWDELKAMFGKRRDEFHH